MLFLNYKKQQLGYHAIIHDKVQDIFPNRLTYLIGKYSREVENELCTEASLTDEEEEGFMKSTRCDRCNKAFVYTKKGGKHRHHCHHTFPIKDANGIVLKGNYIGALCNKCNWKASDKRKQASCVMHNATNYDLNMLIKGLTNDVERIKKITVLPKGNTGYINVKYENASFIDSCSFISASLSQLVDLKCKDVPPHELYKTIPLTVKIIGDKFGQGVTQFLGRKQVYPYTLAKSVQEMESIINYPDQGAFFNHLTDSHITSNDYEFGLLVWNALKAHFPQTMSLRVLHKYYLCSDVCLLADIWAWYSDLIEKDFKMDVASCITGPGLVYQAALYMGKTDLQLLDDYGMYLDFESNIRGV